LLLIGIVLLDFLFDLLQFWLLYGGRGQGEGVLNTQLTKLIATVSNSSKPKNQKNGKKTHFIIPPKNGSGESFGEAPIPSLPLSHHQSRVSKTPYQKHGGYLSISV